MDSRLVARQGVDVTHGRPDTREPLGTYCRGRCRGLPTPRRPASCACKAPGDPPFTGVSSSSCRPGLCVTFHFSCAIYSFPPVDKRTRFRWLPRAAHRSPTAIPTDPSSNWACSPRNSKPPASPGAQPLGFSTSFNLSTAGEPASMDDHRLRLAPPMGQFLSSGSTANLSDDEGFPFLNYLAHPNLTSVRTW
jgi:hypothetical protein